jgi:alkaline phosphatase D
VETAPPSGRQTRRGAIRHFRTAPAAGDWVTVKFTAITCQDYICHDIPQGYRTYLSMRRLAPHFLVSNGDNVYYDTETPRVHTIELARHHWHRMFSMPALVDFYSASSGYFLKDDHDTFEDDCWRTRKPGRVDPLTYEELAPVFAEQAPVGPVPYRKFRWGKGLEIWLMDSRDFRSPNPDPDGPEKTLWGKEQIEWLKRTLEASDAQYRVIVSPTPIVGPDEPGRDYFRWPGGNGDNHINKSYGTEGNQIRKYLGSLKPKNVFGICGDRHWQYFSVDPKTGMHEFSAGPVGDTHKVKPFPADRRYHRFLRFAGGFLSVSLEGSREKPLLYIAS